MPKDRPATNLGVSLSGNAVPIAVIVTILIASLGGVFWLSQLEADVRINSKWRTEAKPVIVQIPVILEKIETINSNLSEIKSDIKNMGRP